MVISNFTKPSVSARRADFFAVGVIVLYCLAYAAIRLCISPSMEMSETEQFLDASGFSLGYSQQAPLYSWIVRWTSLFFGMNIVTLIIIKYSIIFSFYFFFFLIARSLWNEKTSLLITGSLLLFPTFSYEAHRDLTHTMLVSAMALITLFLYIRIMREGKTVYYLLIGICAGLGILSKYNFIFFLAALLSASLSFSEGRRVVIDRRISISVLCAVFVLLPHLVWLARENFVSVHYALARSEAAAPAFNRLPRIFSVVCLSYLEVLLFFSVVALTFRRYFSKDENTDDALRRLLRWLALYGLLAPLFAIAFLQSGNFSSRWLAPVLFTVPLAMFSLISVNEDKTVFRLFGYLCGFIAVFVLLVRTLIGFFPDVVGKVERIHVPYRALSQQLTDRLKENGVYDFHDLVIIADSGDEHIAANIMASMPATKFLPLEKFVVESSARENMTGVLVCDTSRHGLAAADKVISAFPSSSPLITLKSPYLHSVKFPPYALGIVIIPAM